MTDKEIAYINLRLAYDSGMISILRVLELIKEIEGVVQVRNFIEISKES